MDKDFSVLTGQILTRVEVAEDYSEIKFTSKNGKQFKLYHSQDCCESVYVEDVCGDISDLLDTPIVMADESSNCEDPPADGADDSYTWTFYKLATQKGAVTIRWFGTSNGYYSESVDFIEL